MSTIGHPGALRRLHNSHPKAGDAKAVAMATVSSTSLYCGKRGLERGTTYLVALLGGRLLILRPLRRPDLAAALLLEFAKGTYRVTDVQPGGMNTSFVVSRPYGNVTLRVLRRAWYSVNDEVVQTFVKAAATAERSAARSAGGSLQTAAEVRTFARMCAAYGPGAEKATAAAEVEVASDTDRRGLFSRTPTLLLATFPDRFVLLDPGATTHVTSTPVAEFARGAASVTCIDSPQGRLDVSVSSAGNTLELRVPLSGQARIDDGLRDALTALG